MFYFAPKLKYFFYFVFLDRAHKRNVWLALELQLNWIAWRYVASRVKLFVKHYTHCRIRCIGSAVAIPTLKCSQLHACCFIKNQRGLHYPHNHSLHNVSSIESKKTFAQCFDASSFIRVLFKGCVVVQGRIFFILCWKERNTRGKKHFSNAIFPLPERDRMRMKTGRVFFLHDSGEKMENKKSLICGIEKEAEKDLHARNKGRR